MRGSILHGGRVLSREQWWGDDVLLSAPRYFLPYLARAITFADVTFLSRKSFLDIVSAHPRTVSLLRRSTCLLALRREIVVRAKERRGIAVSRSLLGATVPDQDGNARPMNAPVGFIEKVHDAVVLVNDQIAVAPRSLAGYHLMACVRRRV